MNEITPPLHVGRAVLLIRGFYKPTRLLPFPRRPLLVGGVVARLCHLAQRGVARADVCDPTHVATPVREQLLGEAPVRRKERMRRSSLFPPWASL